MGRSRGVIHQPCGQDEWSEASVYDDRPNPSWRCSVCRRAWDRNSQNRANQAAAQKRRRAALRAEVHAAYGGRCACCGETEPMFLTLEHIGGTGAAHRKALSPGDGRHVAPATVYHDVKQRGFPSEFELLCWNCNSGRHLNNGVCPHLTQEPSGGCP